ncbi:MAG TPA: Gfo/Idh/MocA family oxidoreductase [Candidatus Hydrogenedentes bacterium]|nr:Gfo/Idh/MocA family oxidoreductase [Candidatus Hydrogenedentota bacterium]HPG65403.1 Gfo/Idh/MocA family oxidoreductase [Candidatus Hydrogenedentota bacterium]
MAKIGFGILGAGLVAPFHAKSVRDAKGGALVAVCDVDKARADKFAAEFGVKTYNELDAMLADPAIGVVNVTTPNHLHHDAVLKCLAAGKHVLCEKPPAMSLRDTDEMVDAARAAGLKLGCTVQCRVRRCVQAMKSAIGQGRFGRLLHVDTYMKWHRPAEYYHMDAWRSSRKSGAGVTVQHAFHYIDLLQYLGGDVRRVDARMCNLAHQDVELEDTLAAFIEYRNGARGVVQASTALWPGTDIRIEINGENGTAIMVGETIATWKFRDDQADDDSVRAIGSKAQATAAGGAADFGHHDHRVVIQDMIDAIREDREVVIPMATVRHTVEIALAMYASAARNAAVDLPLDYDTPIWE